MHASAPVAPDSKDRNALSTSAEVAAAASIQTAGNHVLATVDAFQPAEQAAIGLFDTAAEADVDKALDDVLKGLRAMEGLEEGGLARVGHVSKGFASADFARLVEGVVKAKLKAEVEAEARRLIKAVRVGEAGPRDEFDRFALNAAAAVEVTLNLVYNALGQKWEAVARIDIAGERTTPVWTSSLPWCSTCTRGTWCTSCAMRWATSCTAARGLRGSSCWSSWAGESR